MAQEIFEKHIERAPSKRELAAVQGDFFALLKHKMLTTLACCLAISGADTVIKNILNTQQWDTAIATGRWGKSALMKLKHASINYSDSPIATSNDHIERHEIIKIAIERSKIYYSTSSYDHIVYIGDKSWDRVYWHWQRYKTCQSECTYHGRL